MTATPNLDWYVETYCKPERHTHDMQDGLTTCIVLKLAQTRALPN